MICRLLRVAALVCAPLAASAAVSLETERLWQRYLDTETHAGPGYRFPYARCFQSAAAAHRLPETLLLAVARGESDFDPAARSTANAHGVMQIQWPGTAKHLGIHHLSALYEPCTNIEAGARYLRELLDRYDGNLHLALAAYNYGPSRIAPGAASIPSGAAWYSAYIYRHLDYVLGDRLQPPASPSLYSELGRSVLLSFGEPYRAQAFVERMEARAGNGDGGPRLDWFRKDVGRFDVVFTYDDKKDYDSGARWLAGAGFPIP